MENKRAKLADLSKKKKNLGKRTKEGLDDWLNENINEPLSKSGYENLGAGISALGSAAGEVFIPESAADVAMSVIPGGKIAKSLQKILGLGSKAKKVKTAADTAEKVPYSSIKMPKPKLTKPKLDSESAVKAKSAVPKNDPKKLRGRGEGASPQAKPRKSRGEDVNPQASEAFSKWDEADALRKKELGNKASKANYKKHTEKSSSRREIIRNLTPEQRKVYLQTGKYGSNT